MQPRNSPLEHLAAFAIVFAAGVMSAASLAAYIARVRRKQAPSHFTQAKRSAEFSSFPIKGRSAIE